MMFQFAGGQFQQVFRMLQQWGLLDVILPFTLIFTIIYTALKNFGPDNFVKGQDKVLLVISLSISLLMVVPHIVSPSPTDMIATINRALPEIGLVIVAIVLVLIMTNVLGKPTQPAWLNTHVVPWLSIVIIAVIFYRALFPYHKPNWFPWIYPWLNFLSDPALQALVIVLLVFGLVVMLVVKDWK